MAPVDASRTTELLIGEVKLIVKTDALHKCSSGSALSAYLRNLRKGRNGSCTVERDGRSFSYIVHYLATGDLVYPLHEGFHRVDALLKELAFFGLAEDVIRNAKQESVKSGLRHRRRESFLTAPNSKSPPLSKAISLHNVANQGGQALSPVLSISMGNLDLESQVKGHSEVKTNRSRFLGIVKRYLSLKTAPKICPEGSGFNNSFSPGSWSPSGGGVFRPSSANGSTLVLLAEPEHVIVYGLRADLMALMPEANILNLRTTSSVFIDSQMMVYPEDFAQDESPKRRNGAEWLTLIYRKHIQRMGFVITVQSQWKDAETMDVHYQWLLHRKTQQRNSAGRRSSLASPVPTTSLGRRASILQRIFQPN